MDWSEKTSCIKCDTGGTLLVCSESGCPLAVHEGCLGCPAKFDNSGRFYCPYCLYKKAVAESRKAREYALARKEALLVFMDEKVTSKENHIGENKTCEENGHNQSKTAVEANGNILSSDKGISKSNNNKIIDKPFRLDEEEKISNAEEEDSEESSSSKVKDPSLENHGGESDRTEEEKQVQEEEPETSAEEEQIQEENHESSAEEEQLQEEERETSAEEFQYQEEEWETSVEKEQIQEEEREEEQIQEKERETSVEKQEEECETSSSSPDHDRSFTRHPRAKRGSKRCKPVDKDSDADPVQSKRLKQHDKKKQTSTTVTPTRKSSRKSSAVMRTEKELKEVRSSRRSRKPEGFSVKLASDALGCAKRKRVMWTEKEEDALRAGVEEHSKGSKTIPWRTILDDGRDNFDATRTPSDLRDKWRNMLGRPR